LGNPKNFADENHQSSLARLSAVRGTLLQSLLRGFAANKEALGSPIISLKNI